MTSFGKKLIKNYFKVMNNIFGMVHGRFQPFHNEHLKYVLEGLNLSEKLIIGITNPESSEFTDEKSALHRNYISANPFTYFQRVEMIKYSLEYLNIPLQRVTITPFHLFDPNKWIHYLPKPKMVTQYIKVFSDWEKKKIQDFINYGFNVKIIDSNATKNITGTEIREKIINNLNWQDLVPKATYEIIKTCL